MSIELLSLSLFGHTKLIHDRFIPLGSNTLLAENWFFPSNFKDVNLPRAKITTSNFQSSSNSVMASFLVLHVHVCIRIYWSKILFLYTQFQLSSSAVAPFIYLTNSNYDGVFSDNGFLAMPQKRYDITFTPLNSEKLDMNTFEEGLNVRTVQDTYSNKPY